MTADKTSTFFTLNPIKADDALYVFVEAISGDLAPIVVLNDFGGKPIRSGNHLAEQTSASIQHTFDDPGANYSLNVSACCEGRTLTTGDFRMLVGVNAPEVLTGTGVRRGRPILGEPTTVGVGIRLDQITGVDQTAKNFGVVASLLMQWTDPRLAFSPNSCQCEFQLLTVDEFIQMVAAVGSTWPEFTIFNQQAERRTQNQVVALMPDGQATYFDCSSTTLQAPDLDFRRFPFDTQQFFIRIDSILPEELYVYADLEGFSAVGRQLGEEEWQVAAFVSVTLYYFSAAR